MTCGIYKLNFNGTDKVYIGKSVNIEYRFTGHLRSFKRGEASKKMRNAYEQYGTPTLSILLECKECDLNINEINLVKQYNAIDDGFNTHDPSLGIIFYGRGDLNPRAKYSNAKIIECFDMLVDYPDMLFQEIADITGVPRGSISMIAHSGGHKWLAEYNPSKYAVLLASIGNRKTSCKSAKNQGIEYPVLISPDSKCYNVTNVREFAREHGLDQSALGRVLNKKAKTHKGWHL